MSWIMEAFDVYITVTSHLPTLGWQQRIYMGIWGGPSPSADHDGNMMQTSCRNFSSSSQVLLRVTYIRNTEVFLCTLKMNENWNNLRH